MRDYRGDLRSLERVGMGDPGLRDLGRRDRFCLTCHRGVVGSDSGITGKFDRLFWYVIVAGVTRVTFREFFGYG